MKDQDIRPKNLMVKQVKLINQDAKNLIIKKFNFVKIKCPACNSKENKFFLIKRKFKYNLCQKCNTYFMSPRPSEKILLDHYKNSLNMNYWSKEIFPKSKNKRIKYIFEPRAKYLIKISKKYLNKSSKISYLEIGSGDASFANQLKKKNFFNHYLLVEPNTNLANISKKYGFNVFNDIFENLNSKKKFDCISSFEVIEHICSPGKFLKTCYKNLKKNGILVFSCPNGEGIDVSLLQERSNVIDHEHLNYFNINSINTLLRRNKFQICEIITPGKLDMELLANEASKKKELSQKEKIRLSWLDKISNKDKILLQNLIQRNKISSHMMVVAKKK